MQRWAASTAFLLLAGVNALWLLLGIAFAAVLFAVLTYVGKRWRP